MRSGHIIPLYVETRGDFIVCGDVMKSISLLMYDRAAGKITERARDHNANYMTAVSVLDDDVYLGAENSFNIFTVMKNADAATDEERNRLDVVGEFHLGEFVNRFRKGSLVMRLPDSELSHQPSLVFGTINGMIGVIVGLSLQQYQFLEQLQHHMRSVTRGVAGLSSLEWRRFSNERRHVDSRGFIDGDLVESFLELPASQQQHVCDLMNSSGAGAGGAGKKSSTDRGDSMMIDGEATQGGGITATASGKKAAGMSVAELAQRVEEFSRLH